MLIDDLDEEGECHYISLFQGFDPQYICSDSKLKRNHLSNVENSHFDFIKQPIVKKFLKSEKVFYVGELQEDDFKLEIEKYNCHLKSMEEFQLKLQEISRKKDI